MSRLSRAWRSFRRAARRGQALVETAVILPVLLTIVLGTMEFGFVFDHNLALEYATREGARVGSALSNGGGTYGCGAGQSPNAANVDKAIIAAVERVLASYGSKIALNRIGEIRIYEVTTSPTGKANKYVYAAGGGDVVDGKALDFKASSPQTYPVCGRREGSNQSIGVSLTYTYDLQTPLRVLFGWATIPMADRTVMAINPTNQ